MKNYEVLYNELNKEFKRYKGFSETKIERMTQSNEELERKLSIFVNIVEVSKYINSNVSDSNLLAMINDMIIGVLGVTQSTIHLIENGVLIPKITNAGDLENTKIHYALLESNKGESFLRNDKDGVFREYGSGNKIKSIIGVPIYIKERIIGYIIVEHEFYRFFEVDTVNFIKYIAHQVAIAIENSVLYKKIQEAAQTDSLLNICNRKYFYELIDIQIKNSDEVDYAIVMSDIDNFKKVNDTYGHQFGDLVLKTVTRVMCDHLRQNDIIARYGGEEIIMFLDGSRDHEEIIKQVDSMRKEIEDTLFGTQEVNCRVTVSFGIAFSDGNSIKTDSIIKKADECLYVAKRTGKNKVEY